MTLISVIGAGGLLGAAVAEVAGDHASSVLRVTGLPWTDDVRAAARMRAAHEEFLAAEEATAVVVLWCAGAGRVASSRAELATERRLIEDLVDDLGRHAARRPIALAFASSAGGVWSGLRDVVIDEATPPRPWHAYGEEKVAAERLLAEAAARTGLRILIGRISNLFGWPRPGRPLTGLVNNMTANAITRHATGIYVPLDTRRDYISARSAAELLLQESLGAVAQPPGTVRLQLIASGRAYTVGELAETLGKVIGRRVPLTLGHSESSAQQPRTMAFRSIHRDLAARSEHIAHELHTLVRDFRGFRAR